ncbi:MAG: hemolysin-like protein [Kordiimonas sp.]|nr:hemolysin-like protein [Kordiimonas sp.]
MQSSAKTTRTEQDRTPRLDPIAVRSGSLEVRLARSETEIAAAQALRYHVFYEEMNAQPTEAMQALSRDFDDFDNICDHLLVVDHNREGAEAVVGTYRLLRERVVDGEINRFYSAQEYDITPLFSEYFRNTMAGKQLLELGRSCVHPAYRSQHTIQLLWRGIARYIEEHDIAYLFGCASLQGTNPEELKLPLSYLYNECRVPDEFAVRARPELYQKMDFLAPDEVETREARRALPPLVKGYLRLGCYIGDGAVVDEQFGTTDVFILLPVDRIQQRYLGLFD